MKHTLNFFLTASVSFLLMASCTNTSRESQPEKSLTDSSNLGNFSSILNKFSLPHDKLVNCDSNSLIFFKLAPFDTSYLLQIDKQNYKIKGVCYIVLPSYHRDLEDFSDQNHQVLFFDGFSFALNVKEWEVLKKRTSSTILQMPDSLKSDSPCFDCVSYSLFHNRQKRSTGNRKLKEGFENYDSFIRDTIINAFLKAKTSHDVFKGK